MPGECGRFQIGAGVDAWQAFRSGVKLGGGISFFVGWYTGDPREITRDMLTGNTYGGSVGGAIGIGASVSGTASPAKGRYFIGLGIEFELGLDASPATGIDLQGTYQYTPAVGPLISK